MRRLITYSLIFLSSWGLIAQEFSYKKEIPVKIAPTASVTVAEISLDYAPLLIPLEAPTPGGGSYRAYLNANKQRLEAKYPRKLHSPSVSRSDVPDPISGRSLPGNNQNRGIPLDTHMGISNGGQIICVINNDILIQDTAGNVIRQASLDAFWAPVNPEGFLFDPKIYYDPIEDLWVMAIMSRDQGNKKTGFHMAFSQTNDGSGSWNQYSFEGNPFNNNTWADYPMMTVGAYETFITVNSIREGEPWETGFEETLLYQIDKASGYAGDSLEFQLWHDIKFGLLTLRNLCPMQGGVGPTGPEQHFLSNRNFDPSNQAIFIATISDTMHGAGVSISTHLRVADRQYFFPPTARQPASSRLATNDSRILDGFIFNNRLQFVSCVMDTLTGRPSIYHGVMEDVSGAQTITSTLISPDTLDLGYPSIAFVGSADTAYDEQDAMIFFDYSSPFHFASTGMIYAQRPGEYSDVLPLKEGLGILDMLNGEERWGDYTVCQRRYNAPNQVWVIGTYALGDETHAAWVNEIYRPTPFTATPDLAEQIGLTAYPNPVRDYVYLEFDIPAGESLDISLLDAQGRQVACFMNYVPRNTGRSRFSFATNDLASGVYLLRVKTPSGELASKKIIVE